MTDLNKEQKEILDNLPQKQLKRMSNMSRVNRARKVYNMLPPNKQAQMMQCAGNPQKVMEIINSCDEELKAKIKSVAGDLLD
jgi:hypothetical protein